MKRLSNNCQVLVEQVILTMVQNRFCRSGRKQFTNCRKTLPSVQWKPCVPSVIGKRAKCFSATFVLVSVRCARCGNRCSADNSSDIGYDARNERIYGTIRTRTGGTTRRVRSNVSWVCYHVVCGEHVTVDSQRTFLELISLEVWVSAK